MGLFKKSDDKKSGKGVSSYPSDSPPRLPELPKLPEFPGMEDSQSNEPEEKFSLPQLPSFPNSSLGDKFSQNTIKDAVSGGKEVDSEDMDEDENFDMEEYEHPMTPPSPDKMQSSIMSDNKSREESEAVERPVRGYNQKQYTSMKNPEPVFIRLDKFEESLDIFKDAKEQISDIENLLKEIKELKEKEEAELSSWEDEIQEIKKQVEKVDQDIFSKV